MPPFAAPHLQPHRFADAEASQCPTPPIRRIHAVGRSVLAGLRKRFIYHLFA
jgi:hypothetical protein